MFMLNSRIVLCLIFAGFVFVSPVRDALARSGVIALVVNDDVISRSDVDARMRLIMVSSGLPNNEQTYTQLLPQIIGSLVDEQIKLQEAEKQELVVSQADIDKGFATIAAQNKFTPEQFSAAIRSSGVRISTLYAQIRAEIAWSKVVQARLRSQVSISDSDVDVRVERIAAAKGKGEYLLSEIFLPVDDAKEEPKLRQLALRLSRDIRGGKASFVKVAQQFSKAAGSAGGGDLGWIQQGQLAEEMDQVLSTLEKGRISDPVRSLSGFHILLVRDKRVISDETIPNRESVRQAIGLERLNRLQRQYFLDLKSAALIENRLESGS